MIIDVPAVVHDRTTREAPAMPKPPLSMIAINPVLAERAGDFEDWLRTVLVPARETTALNYGTAGRCCAPPKRRTAR